MQERGVKIIFEFGYFASRLNLTPRTILIADNRSNSTRRSLKETDLYV
jgi:hypothetical protein